MKTNKKKYSPPMGTKKRILLFDIETMANLGYIWGKYEQDVISFKEHWYMITFAYKWLGEKRTMVYSLPDFTLYAKDKTNDRQLCQKLWELFDQADVVIAHNGDQFDIKKAQARFAQHGFRPPTPFKSVDTKKVAKRYFNFTSNSLDDLGQYLGFGKKINTGGFELWLECAMGKKSAWKKMCDYNKRDVVLLERIYIALRPWMNNHPNMNLLNDTLDACPNCASTNLNKRGLAITRVAKYQRFQCMDCGAWSHGKNIPRKGIVVR
jgi:DNA polymerase elongation subunit (family B)